MNIDDTVERNPASLIVLFDGGCPLCSREIRHYMKLQASEPIAWVDITKNTEDLQENNISWVQAMKELHVIDKDQNIYKGVDAFLQIWSILFRYRFLAKIVSTRPVYSLTRRAYQAFASWRFNRHCSRNNVCGRSDPADTQITSGDI